MVMEVDTLMEKDRLFLKVTLKLLNSQFRTFAKCFKGMILG